MTMSEPDIIHQRKAELRRQMVALRKRIGETGRRGAATAIAGRLQTWLMQHRARLPAVVSGFLPIGDELDPRPAMAAARALGCRIALPVMVGRGQPLTFRAWAPGDPLMVRQWGIREPGPTADTLVPEILLVPLLAFDPAGRRLGYGGGYYDRTLRGLRAAGTVDAIGLAIDQQGVDVVPCLDYDEPLDWILTPSRVIECRSAG